MCSNGSECYQHKKLDNCPICFEAIDKKHEMKTQCNHLFHHECMKNWLAKYKYSCPCCRGDLNVTHNYANVYEDHVDMICWSKEEGYYMSQLPKGIYQNAGPLESIIMTKNLKLIKLTHIILVAKTGKYFD